MKRNINTVTTSTVQTKAATTTISQLGKMFIYIALMEMKGKPYNLDGASRNVSNIVGKLDSELDVIRCPGDNPRNQYDADIDYYVLTDKGRNLLPRYLKACSDELKAGHFGKLKWDKRSKFHKELLARLA
jgi:hypothetical protein